MRKQIVPQNIDVRLQQLRNVFHIRSFESFKAIIFAIALGFAKEGLVRAMLVANAPYNWRRTHDFMRRNRWSHQKMLEQHCQSTLENVYPNGLPQRLFWIVDGTTTDKAFAKKIHGVKVQRRSYQAYGQRSTHRGHGWLLLSLAVPTKSLHYHSLMIGALLKTSSATELAKRIVVHARLPKETKNTVVGDREFGSIKLPKQLAPHKIYSLIRMKKSERVYELEKPEPTGKKGRPREYGESWSVKNLSKSQWGSHQKVQTRFKGQKKWVSVFSVTMRRKGLPNPVKVFRVNLPNKVIYLQSTDLMMSAGDAVWGYLSRQSIEGQIEQVKELGLGKYRGRKAKGVHRWGTMVCIAQNLLSQLALNHSENEQLPKLNWPWYDKEKTVGAIQRRLLTMLIEEGLFTGFSAPMDSQSMNAINSQDTDV